MWPNLIGAGWQQQLAMTASLFFAIIAALKLLASAADRLGAEEPPDQLLRLWHRYEEGDLTYREFERAKRSLREQAHGSQQRSISRTDSRTNSRTEVHDAPA